MFLIEIKDRVMFQTNNDVDDLPDFMPYLLGYINDGYDKMAYAYAERHLSDSDETYFPLKDDHDIPAVPLRYHSALADWATWLVYRNGNPQKQNRGMAFRASFEEALAAIRNEGGADGKPRHFINIPR